ncbi:immunity 8 family protein [Hymenobacter properus]|uniref:Immunity 8 family protein n=1 Tax=Hymenobacter properus TaxID=2791026 RepID=A0A931FKM9_9BACT|nr:immunity 8 family protein [Hymenobacter properus]MBF9143248.1 immunity 8 family protein [Hymenobacter properus]MBR7722058.1 immunity 8 family protein [Microvirga sp. SRT04]
MRAEIKAYERADNEDVSSYEPDDKQVFGFTLLFSIGIKGQVGADYFEVDVASPGYLEHLMPQPFFLRHAILATDYNIPAVVALMTRYVDALEEDSWEALASKISRVARWEFEDYKA